MPKSKSKSKSCQPQGLTRQQVMSNYPAYPQTTPGVGGVFSGSVARMFMRSHLQSQIDKTDKQFGTDLKPQQCPDPESIVFKAPKLAALGMVGKGEDDEQESDHTFYNNTLNSSTSESDSDESDSGLNPIEIKMLLKKMAKKRNHSSKPDKCEKKIKKSDKKAKNNHMFNVVE